MAKVDVILGLQWGDEGKGKIVDFLTPKYDIVARFQGGPNAGHTLNFDNNKYVLNTIPSGIFRKNTKNIIGNGVVINPVSIKKEIDLIKDIVKVEEILFISKKAHLIIPTHILMDKAIEKFKCNNKIGSTLKGISPSYSDKIGRNGLRVGDIENINFKEKYNSLKDLHINSIKKLYNFDIDQSFEKAEKEWFEAIDLLNKIPFIDSEIFINNEIKNNKNILAEGAQGSLLDIDFGTYPYVTSSSTISSGVCSGLGIAPNKLNDIWGIFKAYTTRVGEGFFPTELNDEIGRLIASKGQEFGSTTGRPRRCGWLDLPSIKYAININGVSKLSIMKSDILSGFKSLKICTKYKMPNNEIIDYIPYDYSCVNPVYVEMDGWEKDISEIKTIDKMPINFKNYIKFIEDYLELKIDIISTGPNRDQTIIRN